MKNFSKNTCFYYRTLFSCHWYRSHSKIHSRDNTDFKHQLCIEPEYFFLLRYMDISDKPPTHRRTILVCPRLPESPQYHRDIATNTVFFSLRTFYRPEYEPNSCNTAHSLHNGHYPAIGRLPCTSHRCSAGNKTQSGHDERRGFCQLRCPTVQQRLWEVEGTIRHLARNIGISAFVASRTQSRRDT